MCYDNIYFRQYSYKENSEGLNENIDVIKNRLFPPPPFLINVKPKEIRNNSQNDYEYHNK